MAQKIKIVFPIVAIIALVLLSGCTTGNSLKDLTPEQVVTQFWMDIGNGTYDQAYDLAYHDPGQLKQTWIDGHVSKWGEKGAYIKIYSFNVTDISPIDGSQFEGNFTDARIATTKATISYKGQNTTGQLRMVLVDTPDGWKIYGNY